MPLQIDGEKLRDLMEDFYVLTGIRMVLFDEREEEILSFPELGVPFCREMRRDPEFLRICKDCDRSAFRRCREEGKLTVYRCHAGLTEAAAPLYEDGRIIGYLMFGQVGQGSTRAALTRELTAICESFSRIPLREIRSVAIRTEREIRASAKLLEACTGYIRLQALATPRRTELRHRLEAYVDLHYGEDCSVEALCRILSLSRSSLYRLFASEPGGIAGYVRRKRIAAALELLKTTDLSAGEIAHRVGFSDEAYLRRLLRKETGMGIREIRKTK